MKRNLKSMEIIGVALISLLVMTQVASALDPQGHGDGNYPFNDDMSADWSIPCTTRCTIETWGSCGDPEESIDGGNYEHVHWTGYFIGQPKWDVDCYAWVCANYHAGHDYVLVVGRLDINMYSAEDHVYWMYTTFTIPDAYANDNTIRAWEIEYVDKALPDGDYYYSISYGSLYWEYAYTVTHGNFHRESLEANDVWGSGYKSFCGKYAWGLAGAAPLVRVITGP